MSGFNLPETQSANTAAFNDVASATAWLAGQPQANAPAMLAELLIQIEALNSFRMPPRERFKVMEVLRKSLFAVSGQCQLRYENKPLPLLSSEQTMLLWTQRLWRTAAIAYLHCLQGCLDRDPGLDGESARVAHRVLSCLRMEQLTAYLAWSEPGSRFWELLHSVWDATEDLGVTRVPVVDRLPAETGESTASGQYCMALLLHLADPFSLSRSQFAAACRWFARWRELAKVLPRPDERPKSWCIAIDLAQDRPIHGGVGESLDDRWLAVGSVLRKMSQRLELLAAGEMPEMLKLGSNLSSEACIELLGRLCERLRNPFLPVVPEASPGELSAAVAVGLENTHSLLGGRGLNEQPAAYGGKLSADQIAVFGHFVRRQEDEAKAESWRVVGRGQNMFHLRRPVDSVEPRMAYRCLLAVRAPDQEKYALASVSRLFISVDAMPVNGGKTNNSELCVTVELLAGEPIPLLADIRERPAGKVSRHPAFLLPGNQDQPSSVVLPAGLIARALSVRFHDAREHCVINLRLARLRARGGNFEAWELVPDGAASATSELTLADE